MATVQANGITIEYEDEGSGEPLLLVMGLSGQLIDWPQGFLDELLGRGYRIIRFDNRDSGLSTEFTSRPPTTAELAKAVLMRKTLRSEYLLSDMARDAVGLLDALGIESVHVVGVSMGGMIAQLMAIEHPSRVRSLTSIMSTTGSRRVGQPTLRIIRNSVKRNIPTLDDAVEVGLETFRDISGPTFDEAEFREMAARATSRSWRPEGAARQMAAIIASEDRTERLRAVRVPTLVVHGMLDPLVRPSGGIATARVIPGARLVMFNDMAHDLPRTRWTEIADEIAATTARARQPATI